MWIIALVIGLLTGILTGMISVGGGVIVTSLLILFSAWLKLGLSMKEIALTTSFNTVVTTLSGAIYYYLQKLIQVKVILYFGLPSLLTSLLFSRFANTVSDDILKGIFALFSFIAAVSILFPKTGEADAEEEWISPLLAIFLSVGVGAVGGMIGVSAGFLYIPIFIHIFHLPVRKAVGTGMAVGAMLAAGTILGKLGGGYFRIDLILPLVAGGIAGVMLGSRLAAVIQEKWLKVIMAIVIAGISLQVIYEYLYHTLHVPLSFVLTVLAVILAVFAYGFYFANQPQKIKEETVNKGM